MFEWITDKEERGQVGIGTLIVFIAMVLVAAIAAGVLINTAGFLQSKSQQTGEQSSAQVSDRLQEVSVTGESYDGESDVHKVDVILSQAPGAAEIDLTNVSVSWIGPDGTFQLVHEQADDSTSGVDGVFNTSSLKDPDSSSPVLNDPDDRLIMTFAPGTANGDAGNGDAYMDGNTQLEEGEEVIIKINTMSGATTTIRINIPQSIQGDTAVEL